MTYDKWDIRFARLAREISTWSKDPSSKIGAIIVDKDRRILGTGYNGFPKGIADTEERLNDREEKYPRIIHAEMNALLNCLRSGTSVMDSTLYIYGLPMCTDCTKSVIQSGVSTIIMIYPKNIPERWKESMLKSGSMLGEAGIFYTTIHSEYL